MSCSLKVATSTSDWVTSKRSTQCTKTGEDTNTWISVTRRFWDRAKGSRLVYPVRPSLKSGYQELLGEANVSARCWLHHQSNGFMIHKLHSRHFFFFYGITGRVGLKIYKRPVFTASPIEWIKVLQIPSSCPVFDDFPRFTMQCYVQRFANNFRDLLYNVMFKGLPIISEIYYKMLPSKVCQ